MRRIQILACVMLLFVQIANAVAGSVCDTVVSHFNAGTLDKITATKVTFTREQQTQVAKKRIRGAVYRADLNGDGKAEYLVISSSGTAHIAGMQLFNQDWSSLPSNIEYLLEDDRFRGVMDLIPVQYNSKLYVLGGNGDRWLYVSNFDRAFTQKLVCELGQRATPIETVIHADDPALCQAVLDRRIHYARFKHQHAATGDSYTSYGERAARIDIDNDGQSELVVQKQVVSGGGRGCSASSLAVLTKTRNAIDVTRSQLLPRASCKGGLARPFIFNSAAYVDNSVHAGQTAKQHTVHRIKDGASTVACQFRSISPLFVVDREKNKTRPRTTQNIAGIYLRQRLENPGQTQLARLKKLLAEGYRGKSSVEQLTTANLYVDDRRTYFDYAASLGDDEVVALILAAGVDPDHKAIKGRTPLAEAVYRGTLKSTDLLLRHGANPDASGVTGSIVEDALRSPDSPQEKLTSLLKYGARPNNRAAILDAIKNNRVWALELLAQYGARFDNNREFLQTARAQGNAGIQRALGELIGQASQYRCPKSLTSDVSETCLPRRLRAIDAELNRQYKQRITSLATSRAADLRNAQKDWLVKRRHQCGINYRGKSMGGLLAHVLADPARTQCLQRVTLTRIDELKNNIDVSRDPYTPPKLVVVHTYEAARPEGQRHGPQNDWGEVVVHIGGDNKHIVLVLSSMRSVTWVLDVDESNAIDRVIISSRYPSKIKIAGKAPPVVRQKFGYPSDSSARDSTPISIFKQRIEVFTGLKIANYQNEYSGRRFDIK